MASAREVSIAEGWQLALSPAGEIASLDDLAAHVLQWHATTVPGTVAATLHEDLNEEGDYDADDWWYRATFRRPDAPPGTRFRLRFEGLATLAQVWLNGTEILASRNMFVGHTVDVTDELVDLNSLVIVFRSLERELAQRRPRPRWKTSLVNDQNLRWIRTSLLGRMPGWTLPITPVGPWRPIVLECIERLEVREVDVQVRTRGDTGYVRLRAEVEELPGKPVTAARLRVGERRYPLAVRGAAGWSSRVIVGDAAVENVPLWNPHTHGEPALVPWALEVNAGGEWLEADGGRIGFREIVLDTREGRVGFVVNGLAVFCRGAVWTTADFLALHADRARLRETLTLARDAGLNMLRVGGAMAYESDDFYGLCDELGILVWQDFMFANMDYPVADPKFREEIEREADHQLLRLQRHACIAAYCGGSEIAQQAAMMGLSRDQWTNDFFAEALPRLCEARHPEVPYFPSTPWGGALPMHVATGIAHYYGVGAYRRPLADLKGARVKFATECLGFSNVPVEETVAMVMEGTIPPPHHPRWKARVPRDSGSGYDFEDVRDHYLRELFGRDAVELRNRDLPRYYALSRAVSGEIMSRAFSEWRSPASECRGALVWFFRDLVPGAGWGVVDSEGRPKAAWWYLKRAWAPRTVRLTDEGLDGLAIHVINESGEELEARIEMEMLKHGRRAAAPAEATVTVAPRSSVTIAGDALLGYFSDSTNAYRFGPSKHDVIAVRLVDRGTETTLAEDFHFPAGLDLGAARGASVEARPEWLEDGRVAVTLESDAFLQSVCVTSEGFVPDDSDFHLLPGRARRIVFKPRGKPGAFKAHFEPLNLPEVVTARLERAEVDPRGVLAPEVPVRDVNRTVRE